MKKLLALLLALLMVLTALVACSEPETPDDPKNPQGDNEQGDPADPGKKDEIVPNVPKKDYATTINVLHAKVWDVVWEDIAVEYSGSDVLERDIFTRNSWLEENYGIKMTVAHVSDNTQGMLVNSHDAGDDDWQLYMQRGFGFGTLMGKGFFLNMRELANVDLTHPWWSQGAIDALSFGDYVEVCASDMIFGDKGGTSSMYYNKVLAEELSLGGFYDDVRNKNWTVETLAGYAEQAVDDLNGNDTMDGNDRYGIASGDQSTFMYGCFGKKFVNRTEDGEFYYEYGTGDTIDSMIYIFESILYKDFFYNTFLRKDADKPTFATGRTLFAFGNIMGCNTYRSMEMDYGILPYPMENEEQGEYYSLVSQHSDALFAVPSTVGSPEAVGAALELLSYYSYYNVYSDFYDKIICGRGARDDDSVDMLKIIFANRVYDMGLIFDESKFTDHILRYTATGNTGLESDFKTYESKLAEQIASLNDLAENYR